METADTSAASHRSRRLRGEEAVERRRGAGREGRFKAALIKCSKLGGEGGRC